MRGQQIYFLDTNVVVKSCEFTRIRNANGNVLLCRAPFDFLKGLVQDGYKVVLSPISIMELCFVYHRWFYQKRKTDELAPFDEIFGHDATWDTTDSDRANTDQIINEFISEVGSLGIDISHVDLNHVFLLARVLYRYSSPAVEAYDIAIYANAILENAKYVVLSDGKFKKVINSLRSEHKDQILQQAITLFKDEYSFLSNCKELPCSHDFPVRPSKRNLILNIIDIMKNYIKSKSGTK